MTCGRVRLSWEEKEQIRRECIRRNVHGEKARLLEVCEWAKEAFKLQKAPSHRTVFRILRDGEAIEAKSSSIQKHRRRDLSVSCQRVENELVAWVRKL